MKPGSRTFEAIPKAISLALAFVFSLFGLLAVIPVLAFAQDGTWSTGPSMPTPRSELTSSVFNGKIYAIGGFSNLSTLEVFEPVTNSWSTGPAMPTARWGLTSSTVNGKIYVIGGANSSYNPLNSLEVFNPATSSWTTGPAMPTARWGLTSSVVNGKIYVIGGWNGNYLNIMEVFDPATSSWSTGPAMPTARLWLTSSVVNGKIYVIGGLKSGLQGIGANVNTVEVFDPATNSWSAGSAMPTPRGYLTSSVVNGNIYVIGGSGSGSDLNTQEVFDPATSSWSTGLSMPTARDAPASNVVNGKIYVFGGYSGHSLSVLEVFDPKGNSSGGSNDSVNDLTAVSSDGYLPGVNSITLHWTMPPSSLANVERSLTSGSGYSLLSPVSIGISHGPERDTASVLDKGLTNGKRYYYRVCIRDSAGGCVYSNEVSAIPMKQDSALLSTYTYRCSGLPLYKFDASLCSGKSWTGVGLGAISATGTVLVNDILKFDGTMRIDTVGLKLEAQGTWYVDTIPLPAGAGIGKVTLRSDDVTVSLNCTNLVFLGKDVLSDYVSSKLGGFKFRLDSVAFVDGSYGKGIQIGCALIFPDAINPGHIATGICGERANATDKTGGLVEISPFQITNKGIGGSLKLKDITFFDNFCLQEAFASYYSVPDSLECGATIRTPWWNEESTALGVTLGWRYGVWDALSLKVDLGISVPIGTSGLGLKGVRGSCRGMHIPPLDFSLGGTLNVVAEPDLCEIDLDGHYHEPSTISGTAGVSLLKALDVWQITGSTTVEYDWNKYVSLSGTFNAGTLGGSSYVIQGDGEMKLTWNPTHSIDGNLNGTLYLPGLKSGDIWNDWINLIFGLPKELGKAEAILKDKKILSNVEYLHDGNYSPMHFIVDLTKTFGQDGYITFGDGSIPLNRAMPGGKNIPLAVQPDTFKATNGMAHLLIRIRTNGTIPNSSLTTPGGSNIDTTTSDKSITYIAAPNKREAFWFVEQPAAGNWILTMPNRTTFDTVDASVLPNVRTFTVSAQQQGKKVIASWDTSGATSNSSVAFYLDAVDTGFNGIRVGTASDNAGMFSYTMDDTLPECAYYIYGIRDEQSGVARAYATTKLVNDKTIIPQLQTVIAGSDSAGRMWVNWSTPADSQNISRYLVRIIDASGIDSIYTSVSASSSSVGLNIIDPFSKSVSLLAFGRTGLRGCWSDPVKIMYSGVVESARPPVSTMIAYPNPTSASATLRYSLADQSPVTITLYDALGRIVARPVVGEMQSGGPHEVSFDTKELPSGLYSCRLSAGGAEMFAKMVKIEP